MKHIKLKRSTVIAGRDYFAGEEIEVEDRVAKELIRMGKAEIAEETVEVEVEADLYKMSKAELLEVAKDLEIEIPNKATKEEIIELIEGSDES